MNLLFLLTPIYVMIFMTWIFIFNERKERMATEADLEADIVALNTKVDTFIVDIHTLQATVAELQAQLGAGDPVTQEQLDALHQSMQDILAKNA